MKLIQRSLLVLTVVTLLGVASAKADSIPMLSYSLSGPVTATFQLPQTATISPDNYDMGYGFVIQPIDLMINGKPSSDFLAFYNHGFGGGFGSFSSTTDDDWALFGRQLYSGPESNPTFKVPDHTVHFDDIYNPGNYSLTVNPSVATPEPSTIVLLLSALAVLALVFKRSA